MEEFAYLVNALLKSKVKGHFVMQNGIVVHDVEPLDDYDELFKATYNESQKTLFSITDKYGRELTIFDRVDNKPLDYDIVKFVNE